MALSEPPVVVPALHHQTNLDSKEETKDDNTTPTVSPTLHSDSTTPVPSEDDLASNHLTDSMVDIDLSEPSRTSQDSVYSSDTTPQEVLQEVLRRASIPQSPHHTFPDIQHIDDTPGAEARLVEQVAMEKGKARSRSGSLATSHHSYGRERSDSAASDVSMQVDWETLDRTEEQTQDQESDEQTTLLLARLEQENNAIATDPKSRLKKRARGQSRPPSIVHLQKLVQEQGARSVRFSLLPRAAPLSELDFWAALVRDYPQTAQRLPTVTSNKVRSGIPPPLRGVVWVSMAGARDKTIEEEFDKLLHEPSPYEKMIGKDVGRSFPQHDMFRDPEGEGQRMLGRVLNCYSLYDDKIGYCQGLGFLVGPLLMNMGDKEAFCVLVRLMEDYDLRSCFLPDLSGLHLRIYQFNRLLRQHVPKVSAHLEALGVEGEYLSQWFLSFFAVTCPLPLLFRIYDVIFAEGASETVMRVALSIMQRNEKKIIGYAEFEDVMQLLLSRQLWDVYGLNPASADEFVQDFVSFTSLVTRESLNALEANFREAQSSSSGRNSFLPNVSSAASRFLGRLWSSTPKQQSLTPGNAPSQAGSRPSSRLLRTPSKQSLSTIGSMEGNSDTSASTASTALTETSIISRDSSTDALSLKSSKSPESMPPPRHKHQPSISTSKERELDSQIEDLLTVLSEMQKNQAILSAQLQKMQEDRNEDNIAIQAFLDQVKQDIALPPPKASHRRTASEFGKPLESENKLSPTTIRLLSSLEERLSTRHNRRSSGYETKADLRHTVATVREQLHVEATRSQELSQQLDLKDQEITSLRDEVNRGRARIKDAHFDKQRLEKTILDLRHSKLNASVPPSRSNSKSSTDSGDVFCDIEIRDSNDNSQKSGLRELRLGRGITRTNSNGPTQVFSKRTSSLAQSTTEPIAIPSAGSRHLTTASVPNLSASAPPDNDSVLIELANVKASEAMARQELEELRARFDGMRKMMTAVTPPPPSVSGPQHDPLNAAGSQLTPARTPDSAVMAPPSASGSALSSSITGGAFGFFGWGKKQ